LSFGHSVIPPHVSGASHSPAAGRQIVSTGAGGCAQALPAQTSRVQTLPSELQAWPSLFASAGHAFEPPQVSGTSHSPMTGRQTIIGFAAEHVPGTMEHESQIPSLHAVSQQTPSAQCALAHALSTLQFLPRPSFGVHTPAEQY